MSDAPATEDPVMPAPPAPETHRIPFVFTGTGGEYFRLWIVNLLLTLVTLGLYSPWAKVRRLRYFHGSTSLDGAAFDYHGQPLAILKGRLLAAGAYALVYFAGRFYPLASLLFLPLFVLGVPWVIVRSRRFQMRMTSWRGLRFGFDGGYRGAMGAFVGWPLLSSLTFGVLWPRSLWKQVSYVLGNTRYGSVPLRFTATAGRFYGFCLVAGLFYSFGLIAVSLAFGWFVAKLAAATGQPTSAELAAMMGAQSSPAEAAIAALLGIALFVAGFAWFQRTRANVSFSNLHAGPHRLDCAMPFGGYLRLLVVNVLLVVVTLGLAWPWAKIRQMRYQFAHMSLLAEGDLHGFTAGAAEGVTAVGEEIGDFFDVDFGF